jgi:hypothetical protein
VCEPGFEEVGGLVFVAGEEVAVAVEGDGDGGVAHVGAEGFAVDAGGDHVGGVAVSAFVESDRGESGFGPGGFCVECDRAGVERPGAVLVGEGEALSACSLAEAVVEEFVAEGGGDGDAAVAGAAFGGDESGVAVPAALDADQVLVEVEVAPVECLEFAEAEACVEGGCEDRAFERRERVEERVCFAALSANIA